jgi:hypothetical protein
MRGNSRRWLVRAVENSPQRQGKILAFGCSTFPAHEIVEAARGGAAARVGSIRHGAAAVLAARPRR